MSTRRRLYLIGIVLLTIVLSIPQAIFCLELVRITRLGFPLVFPIPGLSIGTISFSQFSYADMWRNQFILIEGDHETMKAKGFKEGIVVDWKVALLDPETGTKSDPGWKLEGNGFKTHVLGDRLFFCGFKQQYEVVDGRLEFADIPRTARNMFLRNREVAQLLQNQSTGGYLVSTRKSGAWVDDGQVVLPKMASESAFATNSAPVQRGQTNESRFLSVINQGEQYHAFLKVNGQLLYRQGLELRRAEGDGESTTIGGRNPQEVPTPDDDFSGWTLVAEESRCPETSVYHRAGLHYGRPAVLIVDELESGHCVGRLHTFDGTQWSEIAKLEFPFGSKRFRVISRSDDRSAYIVATTSTGTGFAYVVESDGVRQISSEGAQVTWSCLRRNWYFNAIQLGTPILMGLVPCFGIGLLMAFSRKPTYGFGERTVRLASLWRRSIARLIDILMFVAVCLAIVLWLVRDVDWLVLAEAINLKIEDPTIAVIKSVPAVIVPSMGVLLLIGIAVQGRWGLTPGKWVCGLRTLRTTLRPCGFARSLVRELLLAVDSCYLLYWVPGVMCLAATTNRQRLGDLVGDTIVVEARSLRPHRLEVSDEAEFLENHQE